MEDNIDLGRKLIWVQDYPDSLEGESLPRLHETIMRLSRGKPLFVNLLSREDAEELSSLCDAVAAENGHTWRLRSAGVQQARRKTGAFWRRQRHRHPLDRSSGSVGLSPRDDRLITPPFFPEI